MLFLDSTEVKHCKLRDNQKPISGIIYHGKIFTRAKAFAKEELEIAIKECREDFLDHEERSQIATLLVKDKSSVGIWMENKKYRKEDILKLTQESSSPTENINQSKSDNNRINIKELANQMRSSKDLAIKTRRYKLKLYQRCFLGNEAVDWLANHVKISRSEAIKLGQKMLDKGIFHHVSDDHPFKDESLFYRFKSIK